MSFKREMHTPVDMRAELPEIKATDKLHPGTQLGYIHLRIADLQRSLDFYQTSIGFQIHKEVGSTVHLGAGDDDLLVLSEVPGVKHYPRRSGLYHFAILTPSRQGLGRSLRNLIDTGTEIQGGADHLVSEAIYLGDPDGNGIEIYRDRSRDEWRYENGHIKMATDPIDYQGILNEANGKNGRWQGLEIGTKLGHVHLHVPRLEPATNFYEQVLGFDFLMNYLGSAAFLSAGGYHHHIGLNTWNGVGAPPPPQDAAGLEYYVVDLVGEEQQGELVSRLESASWPYEARHEGIFVRDPAQNGILLRVPAGA